ncbi:MAG: flagellar hook-length control protein FliK [Zetaproteobacteria bacterium]|nr:flagellar hook-length control protein FliK [Zetaproteobacteria bacterium]
MKTSSSHHPLTETLPTLSPSRGAGGYKHAKKSAHASSSHKSFEQQVRHNKHQEVTAKHKRPSQQRDKATEAASKYASTRTSSTTHNKAKAKDLRSLKNKAKAQKQSAEDITHAMYIQPQNLATPDTNGKELTTTHKPSLDIQDTALFSPEAKVVGNTFMQLLQQAPNQGGLPLNSQDIVTLQGTIKRSPLLQTLVESAEKAVNIEAPARDFLRAFGIQVDPSFFTRHQISVHTPIDFQHFLEMLHLQDIDTQKIFGELKIKLQQFTSVVEGQQNSQGNPTTQPNTQPQANAELPSPQISEKSLTYHKGLRSKNESHTAEIVPNFKDQTQVSPHPFAPTLAHHKTDEASQILTRPQTDPYLSTALQGEASRLGPETKAIEALSSQGSALSPFAQVKEEASIHNPPQGIASKQARTAVQPLFSKQQAQQVPHRNDIFHAENAHAENIFPAWQEQAPSHQQTTDNDTTARLQTQLSSAFDSKPLLEKAVTALRLQDTETSPQEGEGAASDNGSETADEENALSHIMTPFSTEAASTPNRAHAFQLGQIQDILENPSVSKHLNSWEKVSDMAASFHSRGGGQAHWSMVDSNLGKLDMQIQVLDGNVTLKMQTSNDQIQDTLRHDLQHLSESLAQSQLKLIQVEFNKQSETDLMSQSTWGEGAFTEQQPKQQQQESTSSQLPYTLLQQPHKTWARHSAPQGANISSNGRSPALNPQQRIAIHV